MLTQLAKCFTILGSKDKNIIKSAMDHWSKYTCIDFQRATSGTENYIEFKDGDG